MKPKVLSMFPILILILILAVSCNSSLTSTTSTTTTPITYSLSELKFKLLAAYPDYFWCDPDLYPIARPETEQQNAIDRFSDIKANLEEYSAILVYLNLPDKAEYTDAEKLLIYREHKKLQGVAQVIPATAGYTFSIRTGRNEGKTYQGTISELGVIKVTGETVSINTCPICLATGTLISTPEGPVQVEELQEGMVIYTVDITGKKIPGFISTIASVPVPSSFRITTITLNDGRVVSASFSHPTADGRVVGDLQVGDELDGGIVFSLTAELYTGFTHDILAEGGTGLYWANGILLKSTLLR
jgi:hypothetical protein